MIRTTNTTCFHIVSSSLEGGIDTVSECKKKNFGRNVIYVQPLLGPEAADRHPLLSLCVESYRNRSPISRPTSLSLGTFRRRLDTWERLVFLWAEQGWVNKSQTVITAIGARRTTLLEVLFLISLQDRPEDYLNEMFKCRSSLEDHQCSMLTTIILTEKPLILFIITFP